MLEKTSSRDNSCAMDHVRKMSKGPWKLSGSGGKLTSAEEDGSKQVCKACPVPRGGVGSQSPKARSLQYIYTYIYIFDSSGRISRCSTELQVFK